MPKPSIAPTLIRHIHLPFLTPFPLAEHLQSHLVQQHLTYKALLSSPTPPSSLPSAPIPTILSFIPPPVYTTGRRELNTLSPTQISALKTPLRHADGREERADVVQTLRGGQITFHGPGQLVVYPVLDIKSVRSGRWERGVSVRCYVDLLEEATIGTIARWGVRGCRTENPGVWVRVGGDGMEGEERKIASLGVHLRRNVSSYGVGLNVRTDLGWFDRIVACGLEGKKMVNLEDVMREEGRRNEKLDEEGRVVVGDGGGLFTRTQLNMRSVAETWAREFARGLFGKEIDDKGEGIRLWNMPDVAILAWLKTVVGEGESSGLLDAAAGHIQYLRMMNKVVTDKNFKEIEIPF